MPDLTAGDVATDSVWAVYGAYEDVEDLDGSFVNIERAYPSVVYATELKPGERGNLVVAAGDVVSEAVAALVAD